MNIIVMSDATDKFVVMEITPAYERLFLSRVLPYAQFAYSVSYERVLKSKNIPVGPTLETIASLLLQTWRALPVVTVTPLANGSMIWEDPSKSGFFLPIPGSLP